jgi:hypothetical protein
MINHIHLLLETPLACLGRWLQQLLGEYAQGYNRRHERQGHLWQARYKAILVEDGEYLLECSRYIHLNPNRKKLTRPAELWPWSSYRNYVGGPVMTDWVSTARVLSHFAGPNEYRQYVESGRDEAPVSPFERARAGLVLGSEPFVKRIRDMAQAMQNARRVSGPRTLRRTEAGPGRALVEAVLRQEFPELPEYRRVPLTGYLLGRLTLLQSNEIAELLHRGPTSVTMGRKRIEKRLAQDAQWAQRVRDTEFKLRNLLADSGNQEPEPPLWYRLSLGESRDRDRFSANRPRHPDRQQEAGS